MLITLKKRLNENFRSKVIGSNQEKKKKKKISHSFYPLLFYCREIPCKKKVSVFENFSLGNQTLGAKEKTFPYERANCVYIRNFLYTPYNLFFLKCFFRQPLIELYRIAPPNTLNISKIYPLNLILNHNTNILHSDKCPILGFVKFFFIKIQTLDIKKEERYKLIKHSTNCICVF